MSRDDCPICGDGQHYVPQGCIRALIAKVSSLTARVEELELVAADSGKSWKDVWQKKAKV